MTSGWIKADVWSVGCTVVEMITGKLPYCYYENPITAMYRIANGEIPKINYETKSSKSLKKDQNNTTTNTSSANHSPSQDKLPTTTTANKEVGSENEFIEISSELTSFIEVCCALEPTQRPTVSELLQHPFILKYTQGEEANQEPPPRLFTLQEEIMNVPILPSQSVTLNHQNQSYSDPNRMSQGSGGRGLPLHPITVDESVNLPGGIAHPTSATVNRKYLINTNMSYNNNTGNPLTFESQATPALGLHRNFSTNFGDDIIGMTTTDSTSSLMLPPRSAATTASTSGNLYMNYLAFSREGTANTNYQTYYPPPLTSTTNPATSQRNTATRPTRFSDSYNGQAEEFDLIKQTKIGDLLPSTTYELDEVGPTNLFGVSRDLREDHSRGVLLAPIKSMDPDDYMEEEFEPKVHYVRRHNTNDHNKSRNNNCDDDQVIDEVKDQHYRDDFEKDDIQEVEEEDIPDEVIGEDGVIHHKNQSSSIKQPGISVSYRYNHINQKSNQDFRDSFDESYDSQPNNGGTNTGNSSSSSKKMTVLNADGLVKPNLTPVKIQSKGNLLQASLKKKELENFVVERPTAPLTSEKLVLTETGELSPLKESHLMRLNSSDIIDAATSSSTVLHTSHPNTLAGPLFSEDALTNSCKKMHKMSDYVQASPSNMTLKNSLLGLHDGGDKSQLIATSEAESGHSSSNGNTISVQGTPAEIAVTQAHDDILKVSKLQTKAGAKFIHHPPSSVQQQSLLHQRHRIHHQPSNDSNNQPQKAKVAGQKGHKRSSTEKLSAITSLLKDSNTNTITQTDNAPNNPPIKNMHIQNHLANSHSRSLSAGATLVSSHSNSNLLGKKGGKGGKNGKKTKPNPNTKLPPLEKKTQQDDMDEEEEELGKRYVQSAPAVSRSVNLPPIQRPGPVQLTGNSESSNHQNNPNNNHTNHHQNVLTSITPKANSRKFMYPENIPANQQPSLQPQPPNINGNNTLTSLKGVNKLLDNKKTSNLLGNSGNYSARLQAVPEISNNNPNKSNHVNRK